MNGNDERRQQAAEYALGTLEGAEREAFEARLEADPALRQMVDDWNRRLGTLAEAVPEVEPPAHVWRGVEAVIAATAPSRPTVPEPAPSLVERLWQSVNLWRWVTFAGAAAAALAVLVWTGPAIETRYVAVLSDAQAQPAWLITAELDRRRITCNPMAAVAPDIEITGKAFELWLVPGGDAAPRSLGVFGPTASAGWEVAYDEMVDMPGAAALVISLEPEGGSSTGLPTGPVLYQGAVMVMPE